MAEFSCPSVHCDILNLSKLFTFQFPASRYFFFPLKICDSSVSECFLVLGTSKRNSVRLNSILMIFDYIQFLVNCLGP